MANGVEHFGLSFEGDFDGIVDIDFVYCRMQIAALLDDLGKIFMQVSKNFRDLNIGHHGSQASNEPFDLVSPAAQREAAYGHQSFVHPV
jgi:hypothetical protein